VSSSSLELSDRGLGALGSSSEDSGTCSLSDGSATLRQGCLVALSCSSLCQVPLYNVTALALFPVAAGGLNKMTSYPCLFL
jgi:hypothetical protein